MTSEQNEQIVAYVLGELDENELVAVRELLATDAEAQALEKELRATAGLAQRAFNPPVSPREQGDGADESLALTEEQRAAILAAETVRKPRKVSGFVARTLAMAAGLAAVVFLGIWATESLTPEAVPQGPEIAKALGESEEARMARELMESLPEGIERFFITDVNNPVAVDIAKKRSKDYEDPAVQRQIAEIATRMSLNDKQEAAAQRLLALTEQNAQDVEEYQSVEAKPASGPIVDLNSLAHAGSEPVEKVKSSGLQNLTVGGEIRVRGNWYSNPQASTVDELETRLYDAGGTTNLSIATQVDGLDTSKHPAHMNDPGKVYWPGHNTEAYNEIVENPFKRVTDEPLSTFSIDVDTASYSNVRRYLTQNSLPPADAVRIEELINYFDYDYAPPADKETPFAVHTETGGCPWAPTHRLLRIGLKGWEMPHDERPASNLVFLIDVSGSMQPDNKLPLLKKALSLLVKNLDERDRITMVVYAGSSGLVLPPTGGEDQETILAALDRLESGGSTHGSAGIQLAYEQAVGNFIPGGVNRVILCTDGDFNVGTTSEGGLIDLIEEKARSGVFLTILGFGMGNLKDANLEQMADKGNGNYAYIDTLNEAQKVLVEELGSTLVTIAKDVKIQIEFNPNQVAAYRLVGYENRIMAKEDFNDDTKDAGEIGAGHTVTALYELLPVGAKIDVPLVDPLKYQTPAGPPAGPAAAPTELASAAVSNELCTVKLRYKAPDGNTSKLISMPVQDRKELFAPASKDFQFASAVAEFGLLLRGSQYKGDSTFARVRELAESGKGEDAHGYRAEFLELVRKAEQLKALE